MIMSFTEEIRNFWFLRVKIVNLKPQDFWKFELFALFETDLASSLFLKWLKQMNFRKHFYELLSLKENALINEYSLIS